MTTINGLLKQRSTTPVPHCEETKNYRVTEMPARDGKGAWTKINNPSQEDPGRPYKVLSVEKTNYPPDAHGNVSYNVTLQELSGGEASAASNGQAPAAAEGQAAPPAQPIRSTTTNGAVTSLEALGESVAACLPVADAILVNFYGPPSATDNQQRKEHRDQTLMVALHLSNKVNGRNG